MGVGAWRGRDCATLRAVVEQRTDPRLPSPYRSRPDLAYISQPPTASFERLLLVGSVHTRAPVRPLGPCCCTTTSSSFSSFAAPCLVRRLESLLARRVESSRRALGEVRGARPRYSDDRRERERESLEPSRAMAGARRPGCRAARGGLLSERESGESRPKRRAVRRRQRGEPGMEREVRARSRPDDDERSQPAEPLSM